MLQAAWVTAPSATLHFLSNEKCCVSGTTAAGRHKPAPAPNLIFTNPTPKLHSFLFLRERLLSSCEEMVVVRVAGKAHRRELNGRDGQRG